MTALPQIPPGFWWLTGAGANLAGAWPLATGAGVTVSVVDRGVNFTHADLAGAHDTARDIDPRDAAGMADARPDLSTDVHGTQVAGLIAGDAFDGIGTIGGAWGATLVGSHLRYGTGMNLTELAGIMAAQASFDVSNNSWGVPQAFSDSFLSTSWVPVAQGIETALDTGRGGLGTVFVFAAGNGRLVQNGVNVGDDANFHNLANGRHAITVGATDAAGAAAFFSSPGANLLISAPGLGLTAPTGTTTGATGSASVSGTSFAAALVSSTVALMLEVNPALGWRDVQDILALTARPAAGGTTNGAGGANGGGLIHNRDGGFGQLDAEAAVRLARTWVPVGTSATEVRETVALAPVLTADTVSQTMTFNVVPQAGDLDIDTVTLRLTVTDQNLRGLQIVLTSPDGTRAVLAENLAAAGTRTYLDFTFSAAAFRGEGAAGTWRLDLTHPAASSGFTIYRATLDLWGDAADADDVHVFTDSFATLALADPGRRAIADTDGGTDTLNFAAMTGAVAVDLGQGTGTAGGLGITLSGGFERVIGGAGADSLTADDTSASLAGDDGNDSLTGGAGDDSLSGGAGDDNLAGGGGADSLSGGAGDDVIRGEGGDTIDGGAGEDTLLLSGSWADHAFARDGDVLLVDGTMRVSGVERVIFDDGSVIDTGAGGLAGAAPVVASVTVTAGAADPAGGEQVLATITATDANLGFGDELTFALPPDLEASGLRLVQTGPATAVLTGDPAALTLTRAEICVTDLSGQEARVVLDLPAGPVTVDEGTAGTAICTLPGLPAGDVTLDDARFEMAGDVLRLREGVALDHEGEGVVTVTACAGGVTQVLTILVRDVNEAPLAPDGTEWHACAVEAGGEGAVLTAAPRFLDPEGQDLTYTLQSLPASGVLMLDGVRLRAGRVLDADDMQRLSYRPPETEGEQGATFAVSDGHGTLSLRLVLAVTAGRDDTFVGTAGTDRVHAGAGQDAVWGYGGHDRSDGGSGSDSLYGGEGNDWLDGGAGADMIDGGAGFDRADFRTCRTGLVVSLADARANGGAAAGDVLVSVEGVLGGSGNDTITGSATRNDLRGMAGNDRLDGGGGRDTLTGGAGADTFVFAQGPGADGPDLIADFQTGQDMIALDRRAFAGLDGTLSPGAFTQGIVATDGDDRLIYNQSSGELWLDADGSGNGAALVIMRLSPGAYLSAGDFCIFG